MTIERERINLSKLLADFSELYQNEISHAVSPEQFMLYAKEYLKDEKIKDRVI
jgi:hypothetical protein